MRADTDAKSEREREECSWPFPMIDTVLYTHTHAHAEYRQYVSHLAGRIASAASGWREEWQASRDGGVLRKQGTASNKTERAAVKGKKTWRHDMFHKR